MPPLKEKLLAAQLSALLTTKTTKEPKMDSAVNDSGTRKKLSPGTPVWYAHEKTGTKEAAKILHTVPGGYRVEFEDRTQRSARTANLTLRDTRRLTVASSPPASPASPSAKASAIVRATDARRGISRSSIGRVYPKSEVGTMLREVRVERGHSQQHLADMPGWLDAFDVKTSATMQTTVSAIETGRATLTDVQLQLIAAYIQLPFDDDLKKMRDDHAQALDEFRRTSHKIGSTNASATRQDNMWKRSVAWAKKLRTELGLRAATQKRASIEPRKRRVWSDVERCDTILWLAREHSFDWIATMLGRDERGVTNEVYKLMNERRPLPKPVRAHQEQEEQVETAQPATVAPAPAVAMQATYDVVGVDFAKAEQRTIAMATKYGSIGTPKAHDLESIIAAVMLLHTDATVTGHIDRAHALSGALHLLRQCRT